MPKISFSEHWKAVKQAFKEQLDRPHPGFSFTEWFRKLTYMYLGNGLLNVIVSTTFQLLTIKVFLDFYSVRKLLEIVGVVMFNA